MCTFKEPRGFFLFLPSEGLSQAFDPGPKSLFASSFSTLSRKHLRVPEVLLNLGYAPQYSSCNSMQQVSFWVLKIGIFLCIGSSHLFSVMNPGLMTNGYYSTRQLCNNLKKKRFFSVHCKK